MLKSLVLVASVTAYVENLNMYVFRREIRIDTKIVCTARKDTNFASGYKSVLVDA